MTSKVNAGMNMKNRVRELREAKGLSQATLANAMGVTQTIVSRIEIGKQSLSEVQMAQIAVELGVHPAELIDDPVWNNFPLSMLNEQLLRFISKIVIKLIKDHPTIDEDTVAEVMGSLYRRYAGQALGAKDQQKNIEEVAQILIGHELSKKH